MTTRLYDILGEKWFDALMIFRQYVGLFTIVAIAIRWINVHGGMFY